MATWITHLRIAENLFPLISGLDLAHFAMGNVGPDSGIPDENWEKFDPPVEITHFKPAGGSSWRCADLEFYRNYLQPVGRLYDSTRYSFLLGYFFHLVTDNLWSQQIGQPTKARFAEKLAADPEFWSEIKRDWYGEDFDYVRSHPQCLYWRTFLNCEYHANYLDFLPAGAVQHNIAYIKAFYQRTDDEVEQWYIRRPELYLSRAEIDGFVTQNSSRLFDIYRDLQENPARYAAGMTVLEIALPS